MINCNNQITTSTSKLWFECISLSSDIVQL